MANKPFSFKKPGNVTPSLPTTDEVVKPEIVEPIDTPAKQPKPQAKAKPKAKKQSQTTTETANIQFVFYMTPTEAEQFKSFLDGRPVSSYMRKKVIELIS